MSPQITSRTLQSSYISVFLWGMLIPGCGQQDGVRQYSVPKEMSAAREEMPVSAPQSGEHPAWFLKLTGPKDQILKQAVTFAGLIRSLHFREDGSPVFEVPQGWTSSSGPPPRYQTLTNSETTPPLEISISSLPGPNSNEEEYLLANINRWRGQLELPPMKGDDWIETAHGKGELVLVPKGDETIAMVNLSGVTKEYGESRMLAAIVLLKETSTAAPADTVVPPAKKSPFTYKIPDGWNPSVGNSMRLASFEVPNETGPVDISVTRFPGGGDLLSNVNRWRQQVHLDPIDETELQKSLTRLEIGGKEASYVEAIGQEQAIFAAIVPDGDAKWFFKLQGPKAGAEAEQARFQQFLKSVQMATE